jgi:L-asparaginase
MQSTPSNAASAAISAEGRSPRVVVLGMGGTIAGRAESALDNVGYTAGQVAVADLVAGLAPEGIAVETAQVAQIDSKDLEPSHWQALVAAIERHLARPEVSGIVVTHGTDTLEETAWLLHRVLAPQRPVVLTGAMRPATSRQADGPQNLRDALVVAAAREAGGVLVAFAGSVHGGDAVRKVHPYRLDAFSSGDSGAVARVEEGEVRWLRTPPRGQALGAALLGRAAWPWVEVVTSAAATDGRAIDALVAAGVRGIVVAGTGNGSVHHALEAALLAAQRRGVAVLRATRCLDGRLVEAAIPDPLPSAGALTPQQARVELALRLLAAANGSVP